MRRIKQKLRSKSGTSMLLAMVFMLFCLFVGGSVLAAATANAGRVESLKHDGQRYMSQRSAMQLMAELLKSTPEAQLQLTIQDVTVQKQKRAPVRTVTYTIHNHTGDDTIVRRSIFQRLLYETAIRKYEAKYSSLNGVAISGREYPNFLFAGQSGPYSPNIWTEETGAFSISADLNVGFEGAAREENMQAQYSFTKNEESQISLDCDFQITFEDEEPDGEEKGYMGLFMKSYYDEGDSIVVTVKDLETGMVTTTITKTTVIRWDDPVISKGGAENA